MNARFAVVLCATCAVAAPAAFAGNDAAGADETAAIEADARASKTESYSYTWDELVELIPDIKKMHLVKDGEKRQRVAKADEITGTTKLCRREKSPTSLIARRRCYTLDEYVEQYVQARKYYAEMMSGNMTRGFLGEGGGATATNRTSYP